MADIITYPEDGIRYDAEDASGYLATRLSGVYSAEEDFSVTAQGGLSVQVSAGQAWVRPARFKGRSIIMEQPTTVVLTEADPVRSRIDRIVLRYDAAAKKTRLQVLDGTPDSAAPVAPDISRTELVYDLCLAEIRRPAGSTSVTAADITDTRADEAICGVMRDGVTGIPTGTLVQQFRAVIDALKGEAADKLGYYPVGSIFQTVSFASPAALFGGTWSELDAGTVELPVKNMHIWERMGYLLNVRAIAESSLTITDGKTTVKDTVDASGRYARELPSTGTWTVTATVGSDVRTQTCAVDKYGVYTVELDWKIFGVVWDYGKPSTALTRLTKATDPNGFVTTDITTEPVAAVGVTGGRSPFDSYMPWSGMEEYNITYGSVGAKRGSSGFSRSNDTMVLIPEFYYKVVDDATNKKRYFYISDKAGSGFDKHPGSGRYVGKYKTGTGYVSKTGITALQKLTRAAARTGSTAKGSGWYQFDYAAYCAIILLYIVEYADWDSQTKIGQGIVSNTSASIDSGKTDSMTYHTGRASGTDGSTAVQYRHIEDLWGTICTFVDGINFNGGTVYICTDFSKYADDTATGYTKIGTRATAEGYIKTLGFSAAAPWAIYPSEVGGRETTYVPDYLWGSPNTTWTLPLTGGYTNSGTKAGLFYMDCFYSSRAESYSGSRLMYIPQN